jgi:Tfp pilus assembly protein FimT
MVVLAILAMISTVAMPAFTQLAEPNDLERAASEVKRLLERARLTALARGTRATVVIDPAGPRYRLTISRGASPDSAVEAALSIPAGVVIGGSTRRPQVTFDGQGRSFGDAVVLITEGRATTVRTDPWTGSIHVSGR